MFRSDRIAASCAGLSRASTPSLGQKTWMAVTNPRDEVPGGITKGGSGSISPESAPGVAEFDKALFVMSDCSKWQLCIRRSTEVWGGNLVRRQIELESVRDHDDRLRPVSIFAAGELQRLVAAD